MRLKFRHKAEKIQPQMAPMIDIVFQLLIFFMLTLKIISPEGNFDFNMPSSNVSSDPLEVSQDLKVTAEADSATGVLLQLKYGDEKLGRDPENAFRKLNRRIGTIVARGANPQDKDLEVEINAQYELQYQFVLKAVSAVRGHWDPNEERVVPYIENVKFTKSLPKPSGEPTP